MPLLSPSLGKVEGLEFERRGWGSKRRVFLVGVQLSGVEPGVTGDRYPESRFSSLAGFFGSGSRCFINTPLVPSAIISCAS